MYILFLIDSLLMINFFCMHACIAWDSFENVLTVIYVLSMNVGTLCPRLYLISP